MKLIQLFASVSGVVFSASAIAFPALTTEFKDKPALTKDDTCPNFTGTWKGTCTTTMTNALGQVFSQTTEDTTTIDQTNCNSIMIDNRNYRDMGTTAVSNSSSQHAGSHTVASKWNADKTAFVSQVVTSLQINRDNMIVNQTGMGTYTLRLDENSALHYDLTLAFDTHDAGGFSRGTQSTSCVETRQ